MKSVFGKLHIWGIEKNKIKKIPRVLASCAFLLMLLFVLIDIIIGAGLFYQYVISAQNYKAQAIGVTGQFEYGEYEKVLQVWQTQQQNLQNFSNTTYTNPFTLQP